MGAISVFLNHKQIELDAKSSVHTVLLNSKIELNGIAVAVNNHVIPKNNWESTFLNDRDYITVIQATQGG